MNWYLVKLVFQIVTGSKRPQFDEQMRLVWADEANWALEKARVLGWLEQCQFTNDNNQIVQWKFIEVACIQKLQGLDDGVLLCSNTQEPTDCDEYLDGLRANALKAKDLIFQVE